MASCACRSGAPYAQCCAPLHRGEREATDARALMRSRYAAFACGLGEYLVETLSANHPDRAHGEEALALVLSRAKDTRRFLGLTVLESHVDGSRGEVLFHARIFERGADRSFTERSAFENEAGQWRYAGEIPGAAATPVTAPGVWPASES